MAMGHRRGVGQGQADGREAGLGHTAFGRTPGLLGKWQACLACGSALLKVLGGRDDASGEDLSRERALWMKLLWFQVKMGSDEAAGRAALR